MQTRARSPWLLYSIFFACGIATAQMGNVLPRAHGAAVNDTATGLLLAMQFSGQLCGALFVGQKPGRSILGGLALAAITALALARAGLSHPVVLLLYGLGLGIVMTAASIYAGLEVAAEERNRRMQMLNVFWPLGAAGAPWFVDAVTRAGLLPQRSYAVLAILLIALLVLFALRMRRERIEQRGAKHTDRVLSPLRLALLCLFAVCAVGIESSLANWMPTYATRYIGLAAAGVATTAFWCGILSGRMLADRFLRHVTWKTFGVVCAVLCACATLLVTHAGSPATLAFTAFMAALFVAPLYPAVLAHSVDVRWKNVVFILAGCGSALVPWMVGRVSGATGSLRIALSVPAATAVILAISMFVGIRPDQSNATSQEVHS